MGCSTSKLDDEEAVQLCKDRKRFIKQAVEQRARFASGHLAYVQSLKRVSAALREYIDGGEPRDFLLESFITPPLPPPMKKASPGGFISISPKSIPRARIQSEPGSAIKVNYLRSVGNPAVSVEERPQSPETVRVEGYDPMQFQYGFDGFQAMQYSAMDSSSFFGYSPRRPSAHIPPPSPEATPWDFFWNPFASLDCYGYPNHHTVMDHDVTGVRRVREEEGCAPDLEDDMRGLRRVREEEGIPDLEDDIGPEECYVNARVTRERDTFDLNFTREDVVVVEDVDEDDDEDEEAEEEEEEQEEEDEDEEAEHEEMGLQQANGKRTNIEISRFQTARQVETGKQELPIGDPEPKDEIPGVRFTAYANRRPTSMAEVIKELEDQFIIVCSAADEVATMLEARKAQHSSPSSELTVKKILNPVALIRSASSRSSSSRFAIQSSGPANEEGGEESTSDIAEECMFSGSHQSTLDRLYAWEKKLYDEVRSGEKVRIAYEKKCMQLRNHDVKGDDPSSVEKTRAVVRDLHTQIKVSIHSVEAISKRIETLRDEELQPQLLELVKGLSRMWKVMAECHKSQKRTLDEAKLLLAGMPSKLDAKKHSVMSVSEPQRVARSAASLELELRNWRACFEPWIASQRSYAHALSGWLLRCARSDPDASKLPLSPRRSSGALPIFGLCIQWSRSLDAAREAPVLDGLDFFAAGMGSLYAQQSQQREDPRRFAVEENCTGESMEVVEFGRDVEDVMTAEKLAEVAVKVLCAGMSVAMSSLAEFAVGSAKGYAELVSQWDGAKWPCEQGANGALGM